MLSQAQRTAILELHAKGVSRREISRLLTPFACNSRIAVRCAWLSMFRFLLLSDSFRHPVQFPARTFNRALRLLLLCDVHLRQRLGEAPVGPAQNGERHLQIALDLFEGRGLHYGRLPLRFQKQFRLSENALANHARALAPGSVKL